MQAEIVSTSDRFSEVGPAWDRLWQACSDSVFQSHAWISAWWAAQEAGARLKLQVGLCWDGTELAAAIPCVTRLHRGVRVLEWAAKTWSDYCDAVARPGEPQALDQAWQAIVQAGEFHVVYLSHVRPGAAISSLLRTGSTSPIALRTGSRSEQSLQVRSNGLAGAEWFRTLPKKARNNHTRGKRILGESGTVRIGVVTGAAIPVALDRMIALKRDWLETTGQENALLARGAHGLRSLVDALQQSQALQLFSIDCGGELVAGLVNIVRRDGAAAFFSAFDPRFDRASPGTLVIVEHLLWAFDQAMPEVDFLCGDEPYKLRFANARTELASYVGARTILGHLALAAGQWVDRDRKRACTDVNGLSEEAPYSRV